MSVKTLGRLPSQVLAWSLHEEFCFTVATISTQTGVVLSDYDIVGAPLILVSGVWKFAKAGDHATVDGICLPMEPTKLSLAAATASTDKYRILLRGPAIIKQAGLPSLDPEGATWTKDNLTSVLLALNIILGKETALTQS